MAGYLWLTVSPPCMYQRLKEYMRSLQPPCGSDERPQPQRLLIQLLRVFLPSTDLSPYAPIRVLLEVDSGSELKISELYPLPGMSLCDGLPFSHHSMVCYDSLSHDQGVQCSPPSEKTRSSCVSIHFKCVVRDEIYMQCGSLELDQSSLIGCFTNKTLRLMLNEDTPLKGGYCDIHIKYQQKRYIGITNVIISQTVSLEYFNLTGSSGTNEYSKQTRSKQVSDPCRPPCTLKILTNGDRQTMASKLELEQCL